MCCELAEEASHDPAFTISSIDAQAQYKDVVLKEKDMKKCQLQYVDKVEHEASVCEVAIIEDESPQLLEKLKPQPNSGLDLRTLAQLWAARDQILEP